MNKPNLFREYTFSEWDSLQFEEKREIWNHYWNPYDQDKGQATRDAIVEEFCNQFPEIRKNAVSIGYGYFGFYVGCIFVVAPNSQRVPKHFSDVLINKGTIINTNSDGSYEVKWRDVGGSDKNYKPKTSKSGSRRCLAPSPHTTGHAGPHPAVRKASTD